jgi:ATP-dependent RNA circularization protein (DNA/RNA ligase family)
MRFKYPRTYHFPWSEGRSRDDLVLDSVEHFLGKTVVVSEKLDGENTTLYKDSLHARSLDSKSHPSRNWVKQLQARLSFDIPDGWRICGENVYAKHSIKYEELESYFYVFGIYDENNFCLSYEDTMQWTELLNLKLVPELYRGRWDEDKIKSCYTGISQLGGQQEGYVVRVTDKFNYENFKESTAKFVRRGHIQNEEHWMNLVLEPNKLKEII